MRGCNQLRISRSVIEAEVGDGLSNDRDQPGRVKCYKSGIPEQGPGCLIQLDTVLAISDTTNGFMALPNLIALLVLSPVVARLAKDYFRRMKEPARE